MKVSVALCTYNGEKFLRQQLNSILNQTYPVDEVVIGDDRSTDGTMNIIKEYQLKKPGLFKYKVNENNLGSFTNFEKTIERCSGDYIFLADQDDLWMVNKVQVMTQILQSNPVIDACFSDAELIDENSMPLNATMWESLGVKHDGKLMVEYPSLFKFMLMNDNVVTGAALVIRASVLPKIVPFERKINVEQHDQAIALKLASENLLMPINECLIKYRIHSNQQVGTCPADSWDYTKSLKYQIWNKGYLSMNLEVAIYKAWDYATRAKLYCTKLSLVQFLEEANQAFEEVKEAYLTRLSFIRRKKVLYNWYRRSEFATSLLHVIFK